MVAYPRFEWPHRTHGRVIFHGAVKKQDRSTLGSRSQIRDGCFRLWACRELAAAPEPREHARKRFQVSIPVTCSYRFGMPIHGTRNGKSIEAWSLFNVTCAGMRKRANRSTIEPDKSD